MTSVLTRGLFGHRKTKQKTPCEYRGREWTNASKS